MTTPTTPPDNRPRAERMRDPQRKEDNPGFNSDDKRTWMRSRHPPGCECTRCTGFQPGHKLARNQGRHPVHGAYQTPLRLAAAAETVANMVRPLMPASHPSFEGTLQSYSILLVRIQRAHDAIEKHEAETEEDEGRAKYETLARDLNTWMSSALKYADRLGLTPASAAAILRDTTGGHKDLFRPPTQGDLEAVSLPKLRELQTALAKALAPEEFIDVEAM